MTKRMYLGEPFLLDPLLALDISDDRPGQHVLIAGDDLGATVAMVVGACAAALRSGDGPRVASIIAMYPTRGSSSYLSAFADASGGRITYEENTAAALEELEPNQLIVLFGLDEGSELFPKEDSFVGYRPEETEPSAPTPSGTLADLLKNGHRFERTVLATAVRPIELRSILGTSIDPFGYRIGFGMPEDASNFVLDTTEAKGMRGQAILRYPNGTRTKFQPFSAPTPEEAVGFATVQVR